MIKEKECAKCLEIKPVSEFYKEPQNKSGYAGACKKCSRENTKKMRLQYIENSKKPLDVDNFHKIGKPLKIPKGGFKTTTQIIKFSKFFENV